MLHRMRWGSSSAMLLLSTMRSARQQGSSGTTGPVVDIHSMGMLVGPGPEAGAATNDDDAGVVVHA